MKRKHVLSDKIIVRNNTGIINIINQQKLKKDKKESYTADAKQNNNSNNCDLNEKNLPITEYSTRSISFLNTKVISLSGIIDNVQVFVLFDNKKDYYIIIIKKLLFKDQFKFVSGCNCLSNDDFVLLNESSILYNSTEISPLQKCMHIKECIAKILQNFSINKTIDTEEDLQDILKNHCTHNITKKNFENDDNSLYATISNSDGLLLFVKKNGTWKCVFCKNNNAAKCRHFKYINDCESSQNSLEASTDPIHQIQSMPIPPSRTLSLLSTKKFSGKKKRSVLHRNLTLKILCIFFLYFLVNSIRQHIQHRAFNFENYLKTYFYYEGSTAKVLPEQNFCEKCGNKLDLNKLPRTAILLGSVAMNVDIYNKTCNSCGTFNYQGTTNGIINCGNRFLLCVELVKEYFDHYSNNGTPFTSFMKIKLELMEEGNSFNDKCFPFADVGKIKPYLGQLHVAFCEAIQLFLYDKNKFHCCASPRVIQMDGVVLSVKSEKMPNLEAPWVNKEIINRVSTRKKRQLDQLSKEDSEIIKSIIRTNRCAVTQFENLSKSNHVGTKALVCCLQKHGANFKLYEGTMLFAKTLTKQVAPAASIVPKSCVTIIKK